ncbi:MAG TPA: DUF3616 domain-containing protein [Kofleriaceae bacterium]|nr:DUF3616 domain-containing protein [Kofleriaceae bacterium]
MVRRPPRTLVAVLAILAGACSGSPERNPATKTPPSPAVPPQPPLRATLGDEVVFAGMCDASGAVPLSANRMIAADDEDNVLRVYDADQGGKPLSTADLSTALGLPLKGKKRPRHPEVDLEAATLDGDRAYWVTSHGRNTKGKLKDERLQFFATTVGESIEMIGTYDGLLDDLIADERYARFELAAASELAPKLPGGLNIEGLTATVDGRLFIGFRNPIPRGRALVAPLLNAGELVGGGGAKARFGDPMLLDLGGQGIRSLSWWRGTYLIVAGDFASGGTSNLYQWDGEGAPRRIDVDLGGLNPEGFFSPEDRAEIMLLSDDGSVLVDGVECKALEDAARRSFRGRWLRLEADRQVEAQADASSG